MILDTYIYTKPDNRVKANVDVLSGVYSIIIDHPTKPGSVYIVCPPEFLIKLSDELNKLRKEDKF